MAWCTVGGFVDNSKSKLSWDTSVFWQANAEGTGTYADMILSGLQWTIATAFFAWIIAFTLGSIIGVMRTLPNRWVSGFARCWVELFRNIPILVQLFLWFFVVPELLPKQWGTAIKQMPNAAFFTAVIGLGLATSARVAEQVRAGIKALPRGQSMAGTALGLTTVQTYRYVLLPMAFRIVQPTLTSEMLNIIKNTAVAFSIGLMELTGRARSMQEYTFNVFEAFTAATVLYLLLNLCVVLAMRALERSTAVPGYVGGGK
jgi:glutamate/aspartate transport system permease protein